MKVTELQNGVTIRGLSDKVRRGQKGRVLADDSAGDAPYGYATFYHDPDWQRQLAARGPKPKKGIRVDDVEAGWHPQQVHRVLTNAKYVGRWRWAATTTIRNSKGAKKQAPVPTGEAVVRDRPHLRIVARDVWDRAQHRLRKLKDVFGLKDGQAKRGPKFPTNPAAVHPRSVLGGVLRCQACGQPMWYKGCGGRRYNACSGYAASRCDQSFQVPAGAAEAAVVEAFTRLVAGWPEWVRHVCSRLTAVLTTGAEQLPLEVAQLERRRAECLKQRDNLVDVLAHGGRAAGIFDRIASLEAEVTDIDERLAAKRVPTTNELAVPTEAWVRAQLDYWVRSCSDPLRVAAAVREAVERIDARPVVASGKKRGYVELTVHYRAWELFRAAVSGQLPVAVQTLLPATIHISPPARKS